jgi:hypothetical protein
LKTSSILTQSDLILFLPRTFFFCTWLVRSFGCGYLVAWFNCPPYSNAPESKNVSVMYICMYWEVNGGNVLKGDVTGIMQLICHQESVIQTSCLLRITFRSYRNRRIPCLIRCGGYKMNASCDYFWSNDPGQLKKSACVFIKKCYSKLLLGLLVLINVQHNSICSVI